MIYFISDTHFGHESIIDNCDRPFKTVKEMDDAMIAAWNAKVRGCDKVYIIGDFIYKSANEPEYYLNKLKGKKVLIKGNHDGSWLDKIDKSKYFEEVLDYKEFEIGTSRLALCHYPMLEWRNSRKEGSPKLGYLIYGHTHANKDAMYKTLFERGNALNAGVDINGFAPVTLDELKANNEKFKLPLIGGKLAKALYLCKSYHMHQHDKAGEPYCLHPIYLASKFEDEEHKIVALLHDTLEDTTLSPELVGELFGERVLDAVLALTHKKDEDYFKYLEGIKNNSVARAVKIEDLKHNSDLTRLKKVTEKDLLRVEKYKKALEMLTQ